MIVAPFYQSPVEKNDSGFGLLLALVCKTEKGWMTSVRAIENRSSFVSVDFHMARLKVTAKYGCEVETFSHLCKTFEPWQLN